MTKIKNVVKNIKEELHDAEKYAKLAMEKTEMSATYADLSRQELRHVDILHDGAVRMIQEFKSTGKEVPATMQAIWDWEHEQMTDHKKEILLMLDMAK